MNLRKKEGITLVALVVTVILLGILASIGAYYGNEVIKNANLESLKTDMLLIQAKAKEYVEEVNFLMGPSKDEAKKQEAIQKIYIDEVGLIKADDSSLNLSIPQGSGIDLSVCYYVTQEALQHMGLDKIELDNDEKEAYLIQFNEEEAKVVNIYNTLGYKGVYSLSELEEIEK